MDHMQYQMAPHARRHLDHTESRGNSLIHWQRGQEGAALVVKLQVAVLAGASCKAGRGWLLLWSSRHHLSARTFSLRKFFFFLPPPAGSRKALTSPASDSPLNPGKQARSTGHQPPGNSPGWAAMVCGVCGVGLCTGAPPSPFSPKAGSQP